MRFSGSSVIKSSDYDRYKIIFPVQKIIKPGADKYILEELEKNHPCFSNDFCVDKKFFLKKGKIYSDVVVMNRMKLEEYRFRNGTRTFKLEEDLKKKVFKNHFTLNEKILILGSVIVILSGIFLGIYKKACIKKKSLKTTETEKVSEIKNVKEENVLEVQDSVQDFFSIVKSENGKIKDFEMIRGKNENRLISCVKNLYPEKITGTGFQVSEVAFNGGVAEFIAVKTVPVAVQNQKETYLDLREADVLKTELRKKLLENGCNLLSEKEKPFCLSFTIEKNILQNFEAVTNILEEFENLKKVSFSRIKISSDKKLLMEIETDFCEESDFSVFSKIKAESELFLSEELLKNNSVKKKEFVTSKNLVDNFKAAESYGNGQRKIGEIKHENGTNKIYYRKNDGKILEEVK